MRAVRGILLVALGAVGALAADRFGVVPIASSDEATPPVERTEPGPGDPPLVWISGSLEEVTETQLVLREGDGPRVEVERFAGEATRFFRPDASGWQQLAGAEVGSVEPGGDACVEALADGEAFLAIRVFLERTCAPA